MPFSSSASLIFRRAASAAVALLCISSASAARADSFSAQYFKVPAGTPDFYTSNSGPIGVSYDYVLSTLGPDGLPVFNPAFTTASGYVGAPGAIDLGAGNQLLWWTPTSTNNVFADGSGTVTVTAGGVQMYPAGQGRTDSPDLQTAILTGVFDLATPGTVTFNATADDDAFVYVDGLLVDSIGGVHPTVSATGTSATLAAGSHTVQIFYVDQEQVGAVLGFASLTYGVTVTPPLSTAPEPGGLVLLGTGALGLAGAARRRVCRARH